MYRSLLITLSFLPFLFNSLASAAPTPESTSNGSNKNADKLLSCVQKALGSSGTDRIITPQNDQYTTARTGVILVDQFPALIVYANKISELSPLVKCGVANGYTIAPRTGSHHFENWSALNGSLVIDIANINYVMPAKNLKTATVGGGTRLGAIYSVLGTYGVTFTAGICPSVGIGGYVGVGGYSMQMRSYGLAVDHMESAKVVLANGDLVTVSAESNPELWWAMRGGGTFGITAEVTISTTTLPRSAMFSMNFGNDTRLEVTQKYLDWAAKQDPLFNSQLNLYGNRTNILGWYLGKSVEDLNAIVETSGLNDVKGGDIKISGNCSADNSRNFWTYTQDTCTDDATAEAIFYSYFNVPADDLAPVAGFPSLSSLSQVPALPNVPAATKWSRANDKVKTFIETKDKPLSEADIQWLVEESGTLSMDLGFWAEVTTFNISAKATTSAFPWQSQARTLFRLQVDNGLSDKALQSSADAFIQKIESYLRPKLGDASYAGYIDKDISVDPYKAYYGDNVCRLVKARKQYDASNIFSNPFSIPPEAPRGYSC